MNYGQLLADIACGGGFDAETMALIGLLGAVMAVSLVGVGLAAIGEWRCRRLAQRRATSKPRQQATKL